MALDRVAAWAPVLLWAALIFAFSSVPHLGTGLGTWDLVLRKLAHVTIFGVLWLTLARAARWRRPVLAAVIAVLYAISDEVHQSFVEGRHGSPVDVVIDTVGIGLAALAWVVATRRREITSGRAASAG